MWNVEITERLGSGAVQIENTRMMKNGAEEEREADKEQQENIAGEARGETQRW